MRGAPRSHHMCARPSLVSPIASVSTGLLDVLLYPLSYSLRSLHPLDCVYNPDIHPFVWIPAAQTALSAHAADSPSRLVPGCRAAIAAENAQRDMQPDMQVAVSKSGACAWRPPARVASPKVSTACDWPQNLARAKACETDLPFDLDQVHRCSVFGALAQRTPRSGGYAQAGWRPTVTRV